MTAGRLVPRPRATKYPTQDRIAQGALQPFSPVTLPVGPPHAPKTPHEYLQIRCGLAPRRVRARFDPSVPRHRLDEPGGCEFRTAFAISSTSSLAPRPPGDVLGGVAKVEVYLRENDHVHFQDGVGPCW